MREAKEARDAVYAKSKNSMRVSILIASNDVWNSMQHIVTTLTAPYLAFLSHWIHFLRYRQESLEIALDIARGSMLLEH
eukprot:1085710-Alexandrium_andersonii.AAC.1